MAPTSTDQPPILVCEGVWGDAFADLAARYGVRREGTCPDDLTGVRALVVRNRTKVDPTVLRSPDLRVIARAGVGLDNIDIAAADAAGVVVVAPLGANAGSVAELTLGLALDVLRGISRLDRAVRRGEWSREAGSELAGRVWGVLGVGATGRAVARLAAAFGAQVIGYDPYAAPGAVPLVELDELRERAQVFSVHLPATERTRGLLDAAWFDRMRPGAVLINVGRGDVLDEGALLAALKSGRLAGAALDVRADEPPIVGELESLETVVLTPHIAGATAEAQARIAGVLAADIERILTGAAAESSVGSLDRPGRS
ncbi:MAG: NAD(P)-dependent oxidoreductase [Mycobacteriales bacterium]